jgi:hypothetical protein
MAMGDEDELGMPGWFSTPLQRGRSVSETLGFSPISGFDLPHDLAEPPPHCRPEAD